MVDAHDAERDPAQPLLPRHPVRNRPHVDRRENRLTQITTVKQRTARADRLVVAHILIHGQRDAGILTKPNDLDGFRVIHAERLLREDASQMPVSLNRFAYDFQLNVRRHGDVDDFDFGIVEEISIITVRLRKAVPIRDRFRVIKIPRGNRDRIETRLSIRDEVAVGHDEAGTDAADRNVLPLRHPRPVLKVKRIRFRHGQLLVLRDRRLTQATKSLFCFFRLCDFVCPEKKVANFFRQLQSVAALLRTRKAI